MASGVRGGNCRRNRRVFRKIKHSRIQHRRHLRCAIRYCPSLRKAKKFPLFLGNVSGVAFIQKDKKEAFANASLRLSKNEVFRQRRPRSLASSRRLCGTRAATRCKKSRQSRLFLRNLYSILFVRILFRQTEGSMCKCFLF